MYVRGHAVRLISKFDHASFRSIGFSDFSFVNIHDNSTQLRIIVISAAMNIKTAPIYYRSYKAPQIERFVLRDELIAFSNVFGFTFSWTEELCRLHPGANIPLYLYKDCKLLLHVISKGFRTSECRLM